MAKPAVVQKKLTGRLLHDCAPVAVAGVSGMGGSRRLYIGDGPDLVLYDSGGVFGTPSAWPVAADDDGGPQLWPRWAEDGDVLIGQARFGGTRTAGFQLESPDADIVDAIVGFAGRDDGSFCAGIPLGVTCDFVADREALVAGLTEGDESVASVARALVGNLKAPKPGRNGIGSLILKTREVPAAAAALLDHLWCGEVFVRVSVANGRLLLSKHTPGDVADIPCTQLVASDKGLVGSVMVAGREVEALRVPLTDPAEAARLRGAFGGTTARIPRGTTDQVELVGPSESRRVDLVLTNRKIELRERDGSLVHAFTLEGAAVQGTSTDFLVVDDTGGPFRIRPITQRFQQRILAHQAVAAAAERTSQTGPFLGVDPDGAPISIHVSDGLVVRGGPTPEVAPVSYSVDDQTAWLVVGDWRFSAPPDVLEAAANHLAARLASDPRRVLRELPRLEADWLLHSAFGPLVATHATLVEALGDPLRAPADADERLLVLTRLSERAAYLRRHVQAVRVQLPGVVDASDARLASLGGVRRPSVPWSVDLLVEVERQLERIEGQLAQLEWLRKALTATSPGYGRLAARLGMSIINPLQLVGSGAEAVRLAAIKQMVASAEAEGADQVALACVEEWVHLVGVLVPAAATALLDAFDTPRRAFASRLSDAELDADAQEAIALRYARLANFRRFPEGVDGAIRAEAITTLREWTSTPAVGSTHF